MWTRRFDGADVVGVGQADATCADTEGSYTCGCDDGYSGDGVTCPNIDECLGSNSCHVSDALCRTGCLLWWCAMSAAWLRDGGAEKQEMGLDDLLGRDAVMGLMWEERGQANATCTDTEGSYTCGCDDGYSGDGVTCTNIDECLGSNGCHVSDALCRIGRALWWCAMSALWLQDGGVEK